MNKILPIILVVVLSGCSGNIIEKCADDSMKTRVQDWSKGGWSSASYKEKLQNSEYELFSKICEEDRGVSPKTFGAKWK